MADICASFQAAIVDVLAEKSRRALEAFEPGDGQPKRFVVAGGVAVDAAGRDLLTLEHGDRRIPVAGATPELAGALRALHPRHGTGGFDVRGGS